uniref:Secreted protein n=1 Tax=Knipowitschia caucasica TaxID=637954 RepID=A0AAV2LI66_KNICA
MFGLHRGARSALYLVTPSFLRTPASSPRSLYSLCALFSRVACRTSEWTDEERRPERYPFISNRRCLPLTPYSPHFISLLSSPSLLRRTPPSSTHRTKD